jgi:hypothetical protein
MIAYRIRNWARHFENNRTRELKKMDWIPIPTKQDGEGYRTIMALPEGLEVFGAWVLFCELASKCNPRGCLVRSNGYPHTAATMAVITGASATKLENALTVLAGPDVGWIEQYEPALQVAEATDEQKRRALGRVQNALYRKHGVCTPEGILLERPGKCQWCAAENVRQGRDFPSLVAHHLIGYGTRLSDLTVIFVCRSCHGKFENGHNDLSDVLKRFGIEWLRSGHAIQMVTEETGSESQTTAPLARARGRTEEENTVHNPREEREHECSPTTSVNMNARGSSEEVKRNLADPRANPVNIALSLTGEFDNDRARGFLAKARTVMGEVAFRQELIAFAAEIAAGEEPENRGAALTARLRRALEARS